MNRPSPEREARKPRLNRGKAPREPVPEKFRGLRLRRKRKAKMSRTPWFVQVAIVLAVVAFAMAAARVLFGPAVPMPFF